MSFNIATETSSLSQAHRTSAARLRTSAVYQFFDAPYTQVIDNLPAEIFRCNHPNCRGHTRIVKRISPSDLTSTGNLWRHARSCYGEVAEAARQAQNAEKRTYSRMPFSSGQQR